MSSDVFPLPDLTPLTQLNVQDSLRINAERWELAHQYHQQRQNIHYQALWQPGIVYGLGVKLIAPPAGTTAQFQTKSWIEVQPGFAIDGEGNPIVVGEATDRTYPVTIPPAVEGIQTLYIVIRHVDPKHLDLPNSTDRLQEQFRFDQRINQLEARDIELCRIRISPEQSSLEMPGPWVRPTLGQLDLNHRPVAQLRSQRSLTLGLLANHQSYHRAFNALCQGMQVLYPSLRIQLHTISHGEPTLDAMCLDGDSLSTWRRSDDPRHTQLWQSVKDYPGGLIIVARRLDQTLKETVNRLQRHLALQPVVPPHALMQAPFLFGKLPNFSSEVPSDVMSEVPSEVSTEEGLWVDGRIVIVPTTLLDRWEGSKQSRQDIRTWHELGINLLYYVWYNNHIRKLLR